MVGRDGSVTSEKWSTGIEAIGWPSPQNKTRAIPPRVTKTGTPTMVATSKATRAGATRREGEMDVQAQARTTAPAAAAVASLPFQDFEVFHRRYAVISANPAGKTD